MATTATNSFIANTDTNTLPVDSLAEESSNHVDDVKETNESRPTNLLVDSIEQDKLKSHFRQVSDSSANAVELPGSPEVFSLNKQVENLKLSECGDENDDDREENPAEQGDEYENAHTVHDGDEGGDDGSQSDDSIELNNNRLEHNHNNMSSSKSNGISTQQIDEHLADENATNRPLHLSTNGTPNHGNTDDVNDLAVSVCIFCC